MNICFENKRVLVTGAGSGIGYQVVVAFTKSGAEKVYALSKLQSELDKVASESPLIFPICVDLADWDATRRALEGLGPVDVLVNNAGVSYIEPFLEVKPESFDISFDINVKAIINVSQVIAASMIDNKLAGAIVNMSSQASQIALWNHTVYGATKAAVDSITRAMALELGEYNIRVNAVNPTVVWTEMGKKAWSDPKKSKPLLDRIPLHRFAEIKDVVHAILYLASDKADMVTGTTLPVEGGMLIS